MSQVPWNFVGRRRVPLCSQRVRLLSQKKTEVESSIKCKLLTLTHKNMYSRESMLFLTLWGCHLLLKPLLTDISLILKVSFSFSLSAILEIVKSPQYLIFFTQNHARVLPVKIPLMIKILLSSKLVGTQSFLVLSAKKTITNLSSSSLFPVNSSCITLPSKVIKSSSLSWRLF